MTTIKVTPEQLSSVSKQFAIATEPGFSDEQHPETTFIRNRKTVGWKHEGKVLC